MRQSRSCLSINDAFYFNVCAYLNIFHLENSTLIIYKVHLMVPCADDGPASFFVSMATGSLVSGFAADVSAGLLLDTTTPSISTLPTIVGTSPVC